MDPGKPAGGMISFPVGVNDDGKRLDTLIRALLADIPLSGVYRILRGGGARLNGKRMPPSARVRHGDVIEIRECFAPSIPADRARDLTGTGSFDLDSCILCETPDLLFINKPRGILTHGNGGLDEAVTGRYRKEISESIDFKPAPLHRLDRNTSGILAVSTSIGGARAFSKAIREGMIVKEYLAVLQGELRDGVSWSDELEHSPGSRMTVPGPGRIALTEVEPVRRSNALTLARIRIRTGLTHQIRAQACLHGHPLLGDFKYGGRSFPGGYMLHAGMMLLPPGLDIEYPSEIRAPLPPETEKTIAGLFPD